MTLKFLVLCSGANSELLHDGVILECTTGSLTWSSKFPSISRSHRYKHQGIYFWEHED